jgi:hypothetical protein
VFSVFEGERRLLRAELAERQRCEEARFAENWSNPAYMISFTKPSRTLITLRKQQKTGALAKDFETARRIKCEADQLVRAEAASAESRIVDSMRMAYDNLCARHRREVMCFEQHQRQIEAFLRKECTMAIQPLEKVIAQLVNARETGKNNARDLQISRKPRVMRAERPVTTMSCKAVRIAAEFRCTDAPEPLQLKTIDARRIVPAFSRNANRKIASGVW